LDCSRPGRTFHGIGGNFRLQNPAADPPAIQYNLDNLPVAWGRVAMPLDEWHPIESADPAARPPAYPVHKAMEMAGELARRNIRVIASAWAAPDWALGPKSENLHGRPVLAEKIDALCRSIASYLIYMRDGYGVEANFFSFNESNLGIDVRQTPLEHAEMIKRLGAEFARRGLRTLQLLGDTSNAAAIDFIQPAMADEAALKYVGAISFHSWHGGSDRTLAAWGEAADRLNLPLFCAEVGTDPHAYKNPPIFEDAKFALEEIHLYVRICALCQPASILQWQMTSDYPLVIGSPPRPLRRFWQWKQLGLTPPGAAAIPTASDAPDISCCAFAKGQQFVVHLVNMGLAQRVILSGLPRGLNQLRAFATDAEHEMVELEPIAVDHANAGCILNSKSFLTLSKSEVLNLRD
jgi:hypothetical protein